MSELSAFVTTIVIIRGSREVAYQDLKKGMVDITRHEYFDEAVFGGHRIIAIGGSEEDVCFLRGAGLNVEIDVDGDGISEEMWGRIRYILSAKEWAKRNDGNGGGR